MAKKAESCPSCGPSKCTQCLRWWGLVVTLIGVLYLGQDMGWWTFWRINWWTAGFLLVGLCKLCWSYAWE
ncbi:hypothetical protein HY639_02395 [Candidatus Woesearchaeota archaeon]|nr:hypothetical protein [Candidatus Woesearchaeota archaeon]